MYFTRFDPALMKAAKIIKEKPVYDLKRIEKAYSMNVAVKKVPKIIEIARRVECRHRSPP